MPRFWACGPSFAVGYTPNRMLPGRPRRWRALLTGDDAQRARAAVAGIADALADPESTWPVGAGRGARREDRASLAGGAAGIALFHGYLEHARRRTADRSRTDRWLHYAAGALTEHSLPPGLHTGFTGIAWAHAHLDGLRGTPGATNVSAIDEALFHRLSSGWTWDYELLYGLVGMGVYAVERLPTPAGQRLLALVLQRLDEASERQGCRVAWRTPPDGQLSAARGGHHDLGMAHGAAGVVALLGVACRTASAPAAMAMQSGAVEWLWAQRLAGPGAGMFPAMRRRGRPSHASRLAWCYGDAGIAAALWLAAEGAGRDDWQEQARRVARRAARRSLASSGVVDAGLCHGAAGLGHTFNRIYHATGDPTLGDAARRWFRRALALRQPGQGVAGWASDPGLLTGAAGVGLALLAAISPVEPGWDRCLLLSSSAYFALPSHRNV